MKEIDHTYSCTNGKKHNIPLIFCLRENDSTKKTLSPKIQIPVSEGDHPKVTSSTAVKKKVHEACSTFVACDHDYTSSVTKEGVQAHINLSHSPRLDCLRKNYVRYKLAEDQSKLTTVEHKMLTSVVATKDVRSISQSVYSIPSLKSAIMHTLMEEIGSSMNQMGNRKHGFVSCLMKKQFGDLKTFDWASVVEEGCDRFPAFIQVLNVM